MDWALVETSYDGQTFNFPILKCLQECAVVLERHTSIGIAVRAEHVSVREEACPSVDVAAANRFEAQRLHPMEKLLPRRELIDVRRRGPAIALVDVTRIVQPVAQPRMRFQLRSIGQVDGMGGDVVNGGLSIVAGRRARYDAGRPASNAVFGSSVCEDSPRRLRRSHAKNLLEKIAIIRRSARDNGVSALLR